MRLIGSFRALSLSARAGMLFALVVAGQALGARAQAGSGPAEGTAITFGAEAEAVPLTVGVAAPTDAKLKRVDGTEVALGDALGGKAALIVFYRGGWCPYCNTHLADLATIQGELAARGVEIVAISPDVPAELAKSLQKGELGYTLLSDANFAAMKAFGVGFQLDEATRTRYQGFGVNASNLPIPSVFLVDAAGTIRFVHSNADYKARLAAADVLKAVDASMPSVDPAKDASEATTAASVPPSEPKVEAPKKSDAPTSRPAKK